MASQRAGILNNVGFSSVNKLDTQAFFAVLAWLGQPHIVFRVSVVFILLISWNLAQLTWRVLPPVEQVAPPPKPIATMTTVSRQNKSTHDPSRDIAKRHLFGKVSAVAPKRKPVIQQPAVMPKTKLNLTLSGVFAQEDERKGMAIIAERGRKEKNYVVGDSVPGGAFLEAVYDDRVVLKRGGRLETLALPKESVNDKNAKSSTRTSRPAPRPAVSSRRNKAQEQATDLKSIREQFLQNPQSLIGLIRGQPVRREGKFYGYKVNPGRNREVFTRYGFERNDIVTSVNGIALDNYAELVKGLAQETSFTVEVDRGGAPTVLNLSLD